MSHTHFSRVCVHGILIEQCRCFGGYVTVVECPQEWGQGHHDTKHLFKLGASWPRGAFHPPESAYIVEEEDNE